MVHKVDGNPQLDTCGWSMYSNILKYQYLSMKIKYLKNNLQVNVDWRVNKDWDLSFKS